MMHSLLFAPVVALVLWSFVMCAWLYATRIPAIRQGKIVHDPHRPAEEFHAQLPAEVRWKAGTLLIVSHDRDFLDRLTTPVLAAEGGGIWIRHARPTRRR